ncbi:MAG: sigma-70 family RNA polymerase sigma factor [Gemmataceae bacterium]
MNMQKNLVQEVFVTLIKHLPGFRRQGKAKFSCWLNTILMNKLRDRNRRVCRKEKILSRRPSCEEISDEAELFFEIKFQQAVSRRALGIIQAEFEPTTWQAFPETTINGRSPEEISRHLGVSENAIYIAR